MLFRVFFSKQGIEEILQTYDHLFKPKVDKTEREDDVVSFDGENQKIAQSIQEIYGFHFLAKEVADYTNCTYFEIMDRSVQDVLGVVMVIQAKIEVNELTNNKKQLHG
jgi:hypothetical protein